MQRSSSKYVAAGYWDFRFQALPPFLGVAETRFVRVDREILSFSFYSTFHRGRDSFDSSGNERERQRRLYTTRAVVIPPSTLYFQLL